MNAAWRRACEFDEVNQNVAFSKERQDKRWFCEKYCGGVGVDRGPSDSIWDLLVSIEAPHEPLAVIACVPSLCERFLRPTAHFVESGGSSANGDNVTSVVTKHLLSEAGGVNGGETGDFLRSTIETGLSLETASVQRAVSLVMITDAGQDLDDEMTMVLMRALTDRGLVKCKGAVATLAPARARARLVRGTLNELGLGEVPVAIGTDGGFTGLTATFEETASSYIACDDESFDAICGEELLVQLYAEATPASLEMLVIASFKDAAQFVRNHEQLFKQKTRSVTVMGGVMPFEDTDDDVLLLPDTAHNNQFDVEGSDYFYRRCQELKIPMIVVSRHAAYACPMPRSIYDDMACTGHPIGKRLRDTQRGSIEGLWKRACAEGAERLGLPGRCDKQWFRSTYV